MPPTAGLPITCIDCRQGARDEDDGRPSPGPCRKARPTMTKVTFTAACAVPLIKATVLQYNTPCFGTGFEPLARRATLYFTDKNTPGDFFFAA